MNELQFIEQKFPISLKDEPILPRDILHYILNFLVDKTINGFLFDEKKDGVCKWWYANGQSSLEENWKDGKEIGIWKWWFESGELWYEESWKDGKKDGTWKEWFENGQPKSEESWKDGKKHGVWKEWFENGQPFFWRIWFENEQILVINNIQIVLYKIDFFL